MMKKTILKGSVLALIACTLSVAMLPMVKAEEKRESYAAVVVGTGGRIGGRTLNLNINIDQYTSDQQAQEYLDILKEEGQDALRKTLEEVTVGRIAPVATTGTDLSVARVFQTEQGKVIRLVTPRPIPFFEAYRNPRSMDYPFTIMELRLDQEGKGEGSIMGGAQLRFNKEGQLDIESYGNQYARLVNVRAWD
jgi:hypothetical protein